MQNQVLKLEFGLAKLLSKVPMGWIRMNLIHLTESAFDYAEAVYQEDAHLIDPLAVKRKIFYILIEPLFTVRRVQVKTRSTRLWYTEY